MFLINNVIIGVLSGIFLFFLFTFLNVYTFSKKRRLTSLVLTLNFLYLFFVGPFKIVNEIYNKKKVFINKIKFDKNFSDEEKEELITILNSKYRIFKLFYKSNHFDYNRLMVNFARWYTDKPFRVTLKISVKQKAFETNYIKEMKSSWDAKYC